MLQTTMCSNSIFRTLPNPNQCIIHRKSSNLQYGRPKRFKTTRTFSATNSAVPTQTPTPNSTTIDLPKDVKTATAILKAGESTIYILGISHCSKESCQHISQLIAAVQPDAVLVELCKDRVGLLVDPRAPPPSLWHADRVSIQGLPTSVGWPSEQELVTSLLRCRGQNPVSAADLDEDCLSLLSTGLFSSVTPSATQPPPTAAPSFVINPNGSLATVAPLAQVTFTVAPRPMTAIKSFSIAVDDSLKSQLSGKENALKEIEAQVMASKSDSSISTLLAARQALLKLINLNNEGNNTPPQADVATIEFKNAVDTGNVVAHITLQKATTSSSSPRYTSGFEGSALGGKGINIQPFKRQAPPASSSTSSSSSNGSSDGAAKSKPGMVQITPWSPSEKAAAAVNNGNNNTGIQPGGIEGSLASILTQTYARYQAAAGKKVGISPGAAWQTALAAAAKCDKTTVFYLGDRPANVTAARLAKGIWGSLLPSILGAVVASGVAGFGVSHLMSHLTRGSELGDVAAILAAFIPLAATAWPVVSPIAEISKFSEMSATEIENVVRLKEPIQNTEDLDAPIYKFYGEDALLSWPGAMKPVINERDEFMDRAIVAAALGLPQGGTPAFLKSSSSVSSGDDQQGAAVFKYAMPKGGSPNICPVGQGDGKFDMKSARTVVAVVGTAHVRGMTGRRFFNLTADKDIDVHLDEFVN